jgi:hypothetical protein
MTIFTPQDAALLLIDHQAGTILTATDSIIAELAQDWSTPTGSQLIQVLFQHVLPTIAA